MVGWTCAKCRREFGHRSDGMTAVWFFPFKRRRDTGDTEISLTPYKEGAVNFIQYRTGKTVFPRIPSTTQSHGGYKLCRTCTDAVRSLLSG